MKNYNVVVNASHVRLLGDAAAGFALGECIQTAELYSSNQRIDKYEIPRQLENEPGWFSKTEADWEEIGVTARVWRRVKRQLEDLGVIETRFIGAPPRVWMRVDIPKLQALLAKEAA